MAPEGFKNKISRLDWYGKYFYYLLFLAAAIGGIFLFYDAIVHNEKYDSHGTRYLVYIIAVCFIALGVSGLYFVPNRYKLITIPSALSPVEKHAAIDAMLKELGAKDYNLVNDFYQSAFSKNRWGSSYNIYVSFDDANFYASILSKTNAYYGAGIIDLGGAEKVRKQVAASLAKLAGT